jgi:hypothetical protein
VHRWLSESRRTSGKRQIDSWLVPVYHPGSLLKSFFFVLVPQAHRPPVFCRARSCTVFSSGILKTGLLSFFSLPTGARVRAVITIAKTCRSLYGRGTSRDAHPFALKPRRCSFLALLSSSSHGFVFSVIVPTTVSGVKRARGLVHGRLAEEILLKVGALSAARLLSWNHIDSPSLICGRTYGIVPK